MTSYTVGKHSSPGSLTRCMKIFPSARMIHFVTLYAPCSRPLLTRDLWGYPGPPPVPHHSQREHQQQHKASQQLLAMKTPCLCTNNTACLRTAAIGAAAHGMLRWDTRTRRRCSRSLPGHSTNLAAVDQDPSRSTGSKGATVLMESQPFKLYEDPTSRLGSTIPKPKEDDTTQSRSERRGSLGKRRERRHLGIEDDEP